MISWILEIKWCKMVWHFGMELYFSKILQFSLTKMMFTMWIPDLTLEHPLQHGNKKNFCGFATECSKLSSKLNTPCLKSIRFTTPKVVKHCSKHSLTQPTSLFVVCTPIPFRVYFVELKQPTYFRHIFHCPSRMFIILPFHHCAQQTKSRRCILSGLFFLSTAHSDLLEVYPYLL